MGDFVIGAILTAGLAMLPGVTASVQTGGELRLAQAIQDGSGLHVTGRDISTVRAQVELGLQHAQRALEVLRGATSREAFAEANRIVYDTYVMVRYAEGGVRIQQMRSKYPNPLLEMARQQLDQAMVHLRGARTDTNNAAVYGGDMTRTIQALELVVNLLYQAQALI